jgi:hypothetical protein
VIDRPCVAFDAIGCRRNALRHQEEAFPVANVLDELKKGYKADADFFSSIADRARRTRSSWRRWLPTWGRRGTAASRVAISSIGYARLSASGESYRIGPQVGGRACQTTRLFLLCVSPARSGENIGPNHRCARNLQQFLLTRKYVFGRCSGWSTGCSSTLGIAVSAFVSFGVAGHTSSLVPDVFLVALQG